VEVQILSPAQGYSADRGSVEIGDATILQLSVALDASTRKAEKDLRDAGEGHRREPVVAAQKWRNHPGDHYQIILPEPPSENPTNKGPESLPEPPGNH
jgi:hypothetical protein